MTNLNPNAFYSAFAESGVGSVVKLHGGHDMELTDCYRSDDGLDFVLCFKGSNLSGQEWEAEASIPSLTMNDFLEHKTIEVTLYKTCDVTNKWGKTKKACTHHDFGVLIQLAD